MKYNLKVYTKLYQHINSKIYNILKFLNPTKYDKNKQLKVCIQYFKSKYNLIS